MTIVPGRYRIKNHASWTTLDESGGGGGAISGWTQNDGDNQHWDVNIGEDGTYTIRNAASGSSLFADGAYDGSKVYTHPIDAISQMRWSSIIYPGSGHVVDLDNGNAEDGTSVNLWGRNDESKQQQWFFEGL
ncbi:ricin-type beta-trefoil lectin domain protein [Rhizoctonia solani]|uniref:Ricin-type beta-trefoil lectin domain protein n=1 Tax=Rhizoctonia solani TaxID=456999 RepID=A0A8H8T1P4_9AGAM|nr:ricin-type beta-trefoil lectin domain protein [Rhizoctonia solani]QRW25569.1 ricin-type beta-trefoil lectin domain protein [Rhizoctonia solani]